MPVVRAHKTLELPAHLPVTLVSHWSVLQPWCVRALLHLPLVAIALQHLLVLISMNAWSLQLTTAMLTPDVTTQSDLTLALATQDTKGMEWTAPMSTNVWMLI